MLNFILNSRMLLVFIIPFLIGCLTVFTFQPFNLTFINFFLFPCLFLVISNINKRSKNTYRKNPHLINLFYVGYLFGIGFFLSGTYWISNSLEFDESLNFLIPFTIIIIPLILGLFYGLATLVCGKYIKLEISSIFLFCIMLAVTDYIRSKIFTGFPWNLWAYSWSWFTEVLQILNPIGLFAFNLISISFFCLPLIFFITKLRFKNLIFLIFISLFFLNYLYGNFLLNGNELKNSQNIKNGKFINIKIISPNFDLKYNLSEKEVSSRLKKLIRYSEIDQNEKTLFIWPEGALSGKYFFEIQNYENIFKENFSSNHLIILGINTLDKKEDKFFNSFVIVDNNFKKKFQYNKIKLVPFGEYMPLKNLVEQMGLKKITEGYGSFSKGELKKTFNYNDVTIKPLICYEIIFPELVQNINVKNNLIINISEDGWFGNSIGPHQHFAKSIFRAIEADSFLVRSANKGISAIINNKGKIIKRLKNNETGNIEYKIPIHKKKRGNKNDLIFFALLFTYGIIFLKYKK